MDPQDKIEAISRIAQLRDQGALSTEEFDEEKRKILSSSGSAPARWPAIAAVAAGVTATAAALWLLWPADNLERPESVATTQQSVDATGMPQAPPTTATPDPAQKVPASNVSPANTPAPIEAFSCRIVDRALHCVSRIDNVFIDDIVINRGNCGSSMHEEMERNWVNFEEVYYKNKKRVAGTTQQEPLDELIQQIRTLIFRSLNTVEQNYLNARLVQDSQGLLSDSFRDRIKQLLPEASFYGGVILGLSRSYKFGDRIIWGVGGCSTILEVKIVYYNIDAGSEGYQELELR